MEKSSLSHTKAGLSNSKDPDSIYNFINEDGQHLQVGDKFISLDGLKFPCNSGTEFKLTTTGSKENCDLKHFVNFTCDL